MERHKLDLLTELIRRKIYEKYIGTTFELLWIIAAPLVPLLTTLLVFFYIANIPAIKEMGVFGYSVFVLSGLIPYRLFQKAVSDGCELITGNFDLLKQIIFPLPFLSLTSVGSILFEFAIQLMLLLVLLIFAANGFSWHFLLLPIALILFSGLLLGLSWFLSVANYVMKDIQEVLNVIFTGLLYITPVMYPADVVPGVIGKLINLNPLTQVIIVFRDALLPGDHLHLGSWLYTFVLASVSLIIGYATIAKVRKYVGDLV